MNRDQRRLIIALWDGGWMRMLGAIVRMGETRALIRPNRSIELRRVHAGIPGLSSHFCYVQAYKGRGWISLAVSIATAAAKTSLTSEQFGNILHAIGGGANGYTRPGYRNYYTVSDRKPSLDALVEGGFMAYRKGETMGVYHVTPKGAAEVGCAGCLEQK